MDLIDREQLMNYIRSRKINIGKLAHDVIMKQPSIQPQEPCEDAISRQAVIDVIERWLKCSGYNEAERHIMRAVQSVLYDSPSVKPQEPFDIETYCKEHFCVMVDKDVWEKSEKALEQKPKTIQEIQAESEKYQKAFEDGYEQGYAQARFDYEQEPCDDAISRKEVLNQIFYSTDNSGDVVLGSVLRHRIENLPSVKPQEPKIGHWNCGDDMFEYAICSSCKHETGEAWEYAKRNFKYCPNCGAKMQKVKE